MNELFLDSISLAPSSRTIDMSAGLMGIILAFIAIYAIVMILVWVYLSFAYMSLARKAKLSMPGLAWIPFIGPILISFQASKMHWWPWLLLLGFMVPFLNILCALAFTIYSVIWQWKLFERIRRPGWWALLCLIPIVGLVMIGIAAWSKK